MSSKSWETSDGAEAWGPERPEDVNVQKGPTPTSIVKRDGLGETSFPAKTNHEDSVREGVRVHVGEAFVHHVPLQRDHGPQLHIESWGPEV